MGRVCTYVSGKKQSEAVGGKSEGSLILSFWRKERITYVFVVKRRLLFCPLPLGVAMAAENFYLSHFGTSLFEAEFKKWRRKRKVSSLGSIFSGGEFLPLSFSERKGPAAGPVLQFTSAAKKGANSVRRNWARRRKFEEGHG